MAEAFPGVETDPAVQAELDELLERFGGEEYFQDAYGLGIEELSQTVTYGGHIGSVGKMLTDEACPVGGKIREAYQAEGIDGVKKKFEQLSDFAPEFTVTVTEATLARENLKKKPLSPSRLSSLGKLSRL